MKKKLGNTSTNQIYAFYLRRKMEGCNSRMWLDKGVQPAHDRGNL